jgi:hypothetical protein
VTRLRQVLALLAITCSSTAAGYAQEVRTHQLPDEYITSSISRMKEMDDALRRYFVSADQSRAKIEASVTIFERSGAAIPRVFKEGTKYTIVFPMGAYFLAFNMAGLQLASTQYNEQFESQFRDCVETYKPYLRSYYAPTSSKFRENTIPIAFEHFATQSCKLPQLKKTPEFETARAEFVDTAFQFMMLHEYGHIIAGDLETRQATTQQELNADSFATFHLYNGPPKSIRPVFFFLLYATGYLELPIVFRAQSGAPPLHERLDALFAGARGLASYRKDDALMKRINKEYSDLKKEGEGPVRQAVCRDVKGRISLFGFYIDC